MKYCPIFLLLALLIVPNFVGSMTPTPAIKQKQEELAVELKCRLLKDIANLDQTNRLKMTRLVARLKLQKKNPLLAPEDVAWLDKYLLSITAMLADHDQQKAAALVISEPLTVVEVENETPLALVPICAEATPVIIECQAQLENHLVTQETPAAEAASPEQVVFMPAVQETSSPVLVAGETELAAETTSVERVAIESNQTRSQELSCTE
jgi:hypothetical protein